MDQSAKGGKTSLGIASPTQQAELANYLEYKDKIVSLMPFNTPEKAAAYREILKQYYPKMRIDPPA